MTTQCKSCCIVSGSKVENGRIERIANGFCLDCHARGHAARFLHRETVQKAADTQVVVRKRDSRYWLDDGTYRVTHNQRHTLITLAEYGSLPCTARALDSSIPLVASTLKLLEKQFGKLYERNGKEHPLTTEGERVLGMVTA